MSFAPDDSLVQQAAVEAAKAIEICPALSADVVFNNALVLLAQQTARREMESTATRASLSLVPPTGR